LLSLKLGSASRFDKSVRNVQGVTTVSERQHELLTVREVADAMRVSTMTVYRLIRAGALPAIRVGKHFRIRARDLDEYLKAQTFGGGDAWPAA
jgi:excisionase family DNA binding protein